MNPSNLISSLAEDDEKKIEKGLLKQVRRR